MANHLQRISALAALVGGVFLSANVAAADPLTAQQCATASNQVAVRAVAISQGETLTLYQTDTGTFQGDATVEVYCRSSSGADLGPIQNAQVRITISPEANVAGMFTISGLNGVPSTGGNPVVLGPFDGTATYRITGTSSLLAQGVAVSNIATHIEVVTQAWNDPLRDPITGATLHPGTFGDVIASTPELDSLALFGTGMLGMLGYGVTRLRARRAGATPDQAELLAEDSASS